MGYNSSKFDKDAHYAAKTTRELEDLIVFWEDAIAHWNERVPDRPYNMAINELAIVRMKLAERIGRKK